MVLRTSEIDRWVAQSFEDFVEGAQSSGNRTRLHRIAIKPEGGQESTIESMFIDSLKRQKPQNVTISRQAAMGSADGSYIYDIVAHLESRVVMAVEIKSPFTNHDGIRFHTGKNRSLTNTNPV